MSLKRLISRLAIQHKAFSKKSKDWADVIKYRDSYQCVICGIKPKDSQFLQAHHIKPKKQNSHLKWNHDNGITLCHWCHKIVHSFRFQTVEEARIQICKCKHGKSYHKGKYNNCTYGHRNYEQKNHCNCITFRLHSVIDSRFFNTEITAERYFQYRDLAEKIN